MEVGFFVGKCNELGETISIDDAEEHIFGLCLVNDWSARDIQAWEYQPLGPFLAKNFATIVSPFVVTMEALAPFRVPLLNATKATRSRSNICRTRRNEKTAASTSISKFIFKPRKCAKKTSSRFFLSRSNMKDLYWTIGQMLTHHASNGCNLQTGDLMATGTVSGKEKDERGCLLELTWRGKEPIELPNGEEAQISRRRRRNYYERLLRTRRFQKNRLRRMSRRDSASRINFSRDCTDAADYDFCFFHPCYLRRFVANSFLWQNKIDEIFSRQISRRMRHFRYFRTSRSLDVTQLGLFALQHRGQEACGIVSSDGEDLASISLDGFGRGCFE